MVVDVVGAAVVVVNVVAVGLKANSFSVGASDVVAAVVVVEVVSVFVDVVVAVVLVVGVVVVVVGSVTAGVGPSVAGIRTSGEAVAAASGLDDDEWRLGAVLKASA